MKTIAVINLVIFIIFLITSCKQTSEKQLTESQQETYTCPMHPSVISNKPNACPVCGMELVKKTMKQNQSFADIHKIESITLSPTQRVLANVITHEVTKKELIHKVNAFGVVSFAEPNYYVISSRSNGRIEKLYVNSLGYAVKEGEILFEVYSPEIISAQNELIQAIKNSQEDIIKTIRQKLILHYGLTENQIIELETTKKILNKTPIYSPFSGIVIEKNIQEGQYVDEGMMLYRINDISKVWINLEVYEKDIHYINIGNKVEIYLDQNPETLLNGVVTFIEPQIDNEARVVRVRSEFQNPNGLLKPNMFVTGNIVIQKKSTIVIPQSAVLYTGKIERVWIETAENVFEPREVVTGIKAENEVEIISGIKVGNKVVVNAGYLIDAESNFQFTNERINNKFEEPEIEKLGNDSLFLNEVTILVNGKYYPDIIRAKKGQKITLNFERHDNIRCSDYVIFPDFNIKKYLPPHKTTKIEIILKNSGEYIFYCDMEMIKGKIIVTE